MPERDFELKGETSSGRARLKALDRDFEYLSKTSSARARLEGLGARLHVRGRDFEHLGKTSYARARLGALGALGARLHIEGETSNVLAAFRGRDFEGFGEILMLNWKSDNSHVGKTLTYQARF